MKPFIEVSIVERIMEHSKVRQYKYYKMLIQEFHVKVDMGLINGLMAMFPQQVPTEQEAVSEQYFIRNLQYFDVHYGSIKSEVGFGAEFIK